MLKRLIITCLTLLAPIAAMATPSAAVKFHDQLLGANERSFFVLRSIDIYPGSYYAHTSRLEFIEFSIWDGSRRSGCVLREVVSVDTDTLGAWEHTDTPLPPCDMMQKMHEAGAHFAIGGRSLLAAETREMEIQRHDDGIYASIYFNEITGRIVDWDYIDTRARAMSVVEDVKFAWIDGLHPVCPYCDYVGDALEADECVIAPSFLDIHSVNWRFLKLSCPSSGVDEPSATLFVPVSLKTYQRAHERRTEIEE